MATNASAPGERTVTLDVNVLGRDYKVACREHERDDLVEAVSFLDRRMREIRDTGKVANVERIAVMAALNIANELLRTHRDVQAGDGEATIDETSLRGRIVAMRSAIDQVLAAG